jgi:hypothetical protein
MQEMSRVYQTCLAIWQTSTAHAIIEFFFLATIVVIVAAFGAFQVFGQLLSSFIDCIEVFRAFYSVCFFIILLLLYVVVVLIASYSIHVFVCTPQISTKLSLESSAALPSSTYRLLILTVMHVACLSMHLQRTILHAMYIAGFGAFSFSDFKTDEFHISKHM